MKTIASLSQFCLLSQKQLEKNISPKNNVCVFLDIFQLQKTLLTQKEQFVLFR
jgi:hypothetical protein